MTCATMKQTHRPISERQQLTRLQAFIVASSLGPRIGRSFSMQRRPTLPTSAALGLDHADNRIPRYLFP